MPETARIPGEERLSNRARKAWATMERWERRRDEADAERAAAEEELTAIWKATCVRFGREVPADAVLLDILDSVVVEPMDVWRWRGLRNNKGLATIRVRSRSGTEESLVRYLAIEFGVITEDQNGMLFPSDGDAEDVNPWHRTLRASLKPIGNARRYEFRPKA